MKRYKNFIFNLSAVLLVVVFSFVSMSKAVFAAGGDFANTDFAAAAPFTYDHTTGGGAYNDRTVGGFDDITEQLEGSQFVCGDIVTYLAQITVEANPVDANQTIELDFRFLGNSTGQSGAALIDIVNVQVNYGQVENGDSGTGINPGEGFFGTDSGINDDGGSVATLVSETFIGTPFTSGAELLGTIRLTDLEAGETVVIRIDTLLACDPGSNPTGNLQGQLADGRVVSANGQVVTPPDAISTGQQTIPFLKVGEISGAGEPLLNIEKSVTTASGTCGVDDVETLNVTSGDSVKYCYVVSNPGTATLFDIEVIDDNGTPGDTLDDFGVTLNGLANLDGEADLGDLSGGLTVSGEALVVLSTEGIVVNTAVAIGNNNLSGGNFQELTDSDTATVNVGPAPLNPPIANDDSATTDEDITVTIDAADNDSDPDGNLDPTTTTVTSGPSNGSLTNNGDGTFTYTPNPDFNGVDSFVYQICDTDNLCDTATVTVTVNPVNDPPVAIDDSDIIDQDTQTTINATSNDTDVDGNLDPATATVTSDPSNGSVVNNGDGTFTYTPNPGYVGVDSFEYQVCDTDGACDTAIVTITVLPVIPDNSPPVAVDDSATTDEDTSVNIDATANDTDVDGNLNIFSAAVTSGPSNGSVVNNGDGTFTYTPDSDFNGVDSFEYEVCDTDGLCDTATVTITVNTENDAPVAIDDIYNTLEDITLTVGAPGVLVNDSDVDGDVLTVNLLTNPSNGTLTQNADGSLTYTPNADFVGTDSYTYEACDPNNVCDPATVTIDVTPLNDPPVAVDDIAETDEETPVIIDVLDNDSDVDGNLDASSITVTSEPSDGTVTINEDGTLTYTPDPDFNGIDSFEYQVCDTDGLCDTATVIVTVNQVNDVPVANDDTYSTSEDTELVVTAPGVLDNDSDVDGDVLTVNLLTNPSNGTLTQNADGSLTYTPNPDFNGTDSYTYEACDPSNACDDATVTIDVIAVNDPPVAVDDSAATDEDIAVTVDATNNDSDPDGNLDPATATVTSGPSNGTVVNNGDGTFTYTPDPDFNGTDSFDYSVCDSKGECDSATVTITVNAVNDAPVAIDDTYSTLEDTTLTVGIPGVLGNDSDVDGDDLTVNLLTGPSHGTLVQNADGSFTYTPDANFNGTDSYTYEACDPSGLCDAAKVTIIVGPDNDAPVAVDDVYSTPEDTTLTVSAPGVLGNDSDADGDALTVNKLTDPSHGTLTQNADGSLTYTPVANYNGEDSYTYEACDPIGVCDSATVTITVTPVNDPPVAIDDSASTNEDTAVTIDATNNDYDVDGDLNPSSATVTSEPTNGEVTSNGDGTFTYTPDLDFSGTDSFEYTVCDDAGECDTATVTITVNAVNDAPVANDDAYSTPEDTILTVSAPGVLGNDSDVDGDDLTVNLLTEPSNGTLEQNADGSFTYTPEANFSGVDSYTYEACDPSNQCDTATVTITVTPVNDPPVAVDDAYSTTQDTTLTVVAPGVLNNDSDIDGDVIFVDSNDVTSQFGGSVTMNSDGSFEYTPTSGFAGIDTFTYTISDDNGGFDTATVTITVEAKNNRSISVAWSDWSLAGTSLSGNFSITNQSDGYDVQITDLAISVEYRIPGGGWIPVVIVEDSCVFNPSPLFLVVDQQSVNFSNCELTEVIPDGATVRVTAEVKIFGRIKGKGKADSWFLSRLSK